MNPASTNEPPNLPAAPAWHGYAWAITGVTVAALVAAVLQAHFAPVNIVMLFLIVVVGVAYRHGRGPAVLAAVLGVAVFDFFFVPPQLSFAVADAQYLVTFAVMLATGLVIAQLTSRLRQSAVDAVARERRAGELYELARVLSGALADAQVVEAARNFFERCFHADIVLLPRRADGHLGLPDDGAAAAAALVDTNVARAVFLLEPDRADPVPAVSSAGVHYLPLRAPMRIRGVLAVVPRAIANDRADGQATHDPIEARYMATAAAVIAIALERVHFVTVAREATVQMASERLRNTLLSALSHDLRTPLTAILGSAESLRLNAGALPAEQVALIDAIAEQSRRTSDLVDNILEMARLESGALRVQKEWHSLEEIIGAALAARADLLRQHKVRVAVPPNAPMVPCDALMIERVFVNLLENAAKYSPAGSEIRVDVVPGDAETLVTVTDQGSGIAPGDEESIFGKFVRGESASHIPGLGLGLAICRSIVEAHGGRMQASNVTSKGAVVSFTLPSGAPPDMPAENDGNDGSPA